MKRIAILMALFALAGCASTNKDAIFRAYLYGVAEGRVKALCAADRLTVAECASAKELGDQLRLGILAEKAPPDYAALLTVLDRLMSFGSKGLVR